MLWVFQKNDLLETNYLHDGRNLALNYFAKIRRDATAKDFFAVAFQARGVSAEWYFYKILDHSNRPILSRPFLKNPNSDTAQPIKLTTFYIFLFFIIN